MGNGMNKIIPGLFVGNIRDAKDSVQLSENKITHILSIHDNAKPILPNKEYLCLAASDHAQQDLLQFIQQTNDFIHKARVNGGNVLVHCLAGVSRSVTITVVYIMTITNLNWRDALNAVRGARRCANPNFGFQRQLLSFQHEGLDQERQRLRKKFGDKNLKVPCNDIAECKRLLEIHQQWVLHGDQVGTEVDNLYPLPLGAYGRKDDSQKSDKKDEAGKMAEAQKLASQESAPKSHLESDMDNLQMTTSATTSACSGIGPDISDMGTADLINEMFSADKIKAMEAILAPDTNLREYVAQSRAENPTTSTSTPAAAAAAACTPDSASDGLNEAASLDTPPPAQPESDDVTKATLDAMFDNSNVR